MKINLLKPKIRKISLYETKGYGNEYTWSDVMEMTDSEYMSKTMRAINWYYQFYSRKEGQEWLIAWYHNNFPKRRGDIKLISNAKSDKFTNLLCALYPMEQQGWKPRFNVLRHVVRHLDEVLVSGKDRTEIARAESMPDETTLTAAPVSIQEKIREQAGQMSEEIDAAIDSFIMDPDNFDAKAFKMVNLLRGKGVKAAQARCIKGFYTRSQAELASLAGGAADVQIREAYSHLPRKNVRKLLEFFDSIMIACDQIIGEAKVLKKPRAKKVKPMEDLVKKLKFQVSDDKLGLVSIPPVQLLNAQVAIVFNTKTRKLGVYNSKSLTGLTVKGSSIENFSEKSIQKTLRKPLEQLKTFKEQNTQRKFENWFSKEVTTTDTALTGRINQDTLIIKVFK